MKLTEEYFFPTITNEGADELYRFATAIMLKSGSQIPFTQHEDLLQSMILKCLEKLSSFDENKGIPLGGFLYWQCRGAISMWANKNRREYPMQPEAVLTLKRYKEK